MKIIEPSAELAQDLNAAEIMRHLERAGIVAGAEIFARKK